MATFTFFDKYKETLISNLTSPIDWDADTFKIGLTTNAYTPGATDQFWDLPAANEVSGTNYSAGGVTTTATVSGAGTATMKVLLSNVTWSQSGSGFTNAQIMCIYKSTGAPSTSPLIAYYNFGSAVGNVSGDLTIAFDATNGAFVLT